MPVAVKISSQASQIASAPVQTVQGAVPIPPGGSIALDVQPGAVAGFSREGADLLVQLKSGEVVRITNFYADPTKASQLMLVEGDRLVAADVAQIPAGAAATPAYVPMDAMAGFEGSAAAEAAGAAAAGGGGGLGAGVLLPIIALGGGAAIAAVASGGDDDDGDDDAPVTPPDTTAPAAATDLAINAAGDRLTGRAEAGATVNVDIDRNGTTDASATVAGDGTFSVTLSPAQLNGQTVSVTVRDAAGNTSPAATATAPDTTVPAAATELAIAEDGTALTGRAEAGATVRVDIDGDGTPDYTGTAAADGTFSIALVPALLNGETVSVTVRDAAGNTSPAATADAPDTTAPEPAFVLFAADGSGLTGTGEAGATVTIDIDGDAEPDYTTTIDEDGTFSILFAEPLDDGEQVDVTVTDSEGNSSEPVTETAPDVVPPPADAPVVDPSNGATFTGTAQSGVAVILVDATGTIVGQAPIASDGSWSFTPNPSVPDGTTLSVAAVNSEGQPGPSTLVTVDAEAPPAPTLALSDGESLSGTAEAGATVLLTDANGNPIGETVADEDGAWSFTPATPLPDGTVINAAARDAAGNTGPHASVTVDAAAPPAPTLAPPSGTLLSGTAEPGSTVLLTNGAGTPIGQVVVGIGGTWSFTPSPALADGSTVNAVARDATGNVSPIATATVDAVAPGAPTIAPSQGIVLSGTAEGGATILLTNAAGTPIGQTTASAGGTWSFTPATPLPDGTVVTAVARDAAGNTGPGASTTVDAVAPPTPAIQPTSGTVVTGTAEAGALITLTDGNGNPIGQTVASGTGSWSFTPGTPLPNGVVIRATAQDGAGNTSPPAATTVDSVPPPTPVIAASNGAALSGTAEAGARILLTNGAGDPIGQATADGLGNWSFSPATPLPDGTVVRAVAQDAAGNTSGQASTIIDAVPPPAPVIDATNGAVISGTAEVGAIVLLTGANGNPIGQTTANSLGNWSFSPATPLPDGTVVNAAARDAAGNTGPGASTTVDAAPPPAPPIDPTSGTVVTGTAEAGALITLTDGNGNPIGQTTADGNGDWSVTPATPLPDGTVINAVASDAAGNTSLASTTTVDATPPPAPVIDPTDGSLITGTAENGASLILTDGNGNPIGQTTADGNGDWSFTPSAPLPDGTVVNAIARDAAGNASPSSSATVDSAPPAQPTINPTDGSVVTGTAEPNSTVVLMDGSGIPFAASSAGQAALAAIPDLGLPIGQTIADANGNWTFIAIPPLPDGTVIIAVSVDAAGNVSSSVDTTVDSVPPAIPTIDLSDGLLLAGTADPDTIIRLQDSLGNPIGETTADANGDWTFVPTLPLPDGTAVTVIAVDAAGNDSPPAGITIDAKAPPLPVAQASNGTVLSGNAEPGATVLLADGLGNPIGQTTADGNGNWSFTPATPLPNTTIVHVTAQDATGNTSLETLITIDSAPPPPPVLGLLGGGALLTGTAEPNTEVRIVIDGNIANPIIVNVGGSGFFTLPLLPPLTAAQTVSATAVDAAGNASTPAVLIVPDIAPPAIFVPETADGWLNASEASNGIQVEVVVRPTMQAGQVITAQFSGQGGYQVQATHTLTTGDILAGLVVLSIVPTGSLGAFPQGSGTVTASVDTGAASAPIPITVDTNVPLQPLLSLDGSLLTISSSPGEELWVTVNSGGITTSTMVTANAFGTGALNLLSDLDIQLDWAQLLESQVSVTARDPAGNASTPASLTVGASLDTPPTVENLALDVNLLFPLSFGISGTTEPGASVVIRVTAPLLDVELLPVQADSNGNFSLNLLDPAILLQLNLNVLQLLELGADISLGIVATDTQNNSSALYGLDLRLDALGTGLEISQLDVSGTLGDDILAGSAALERLNGNGGNDLILATGTGDHAMAGAGNDTIQLTATNFVNADGGTGFDTVLLANGIDLDYGVGVGTFASIERFDLGTGDSGSVLTLTAAEVNAITDPGHTLQITGEANDQLRVFGALNTGTTQTVEGVVYDVYTFGTNTLLIEDNSVQVVV